MEDWAVTSSPMHPARPNSERCRALPRQRCPPHLCQTPLAVARASPPARASESGDRGGMGPGPERAAAPGPSALVASWRGLVLDGVATFFAISRAAWDAAWGRRKGGCGWAGEQTGSVRVQVGTEACGCRCRWKAGQSMRLRGSSPPRPPSASAPRPAPSSAPPPRLSAARPSP